MSSWSNVKFSASDLPPPTVNSANSSSFKYLFKYYSPNKKTK